MPTADVCRFLARLITAAVSLGAVWGATAEILRDRQHSKYVRDQLAARRITTGV